MGAPFSRFISILSSNLMTFAMQPSKGMDVEAARDDLNRRTLVHLGYDFAPLIYLCALRDFSTGAYHHHGLVNCFSEFAATAAITSWHEEVFLRLTLGALDSLVAQIDRFVSYVSERLPSDCGHLADSRDLPYSGTFFRRPNSSAQTLRSRCSF